MREENGVLRRIAWREICPWLIIFRSFRLSISLPVLLLATVGWILTPAGAAVANRLFLGNDVFSAASWLAEPGAALAVFRSASFLDGQPTPIPYVYDQLLSSPVMLVTTPMSWSMCAYHLARSVWNVAVWSFFAVAICRIAAVQLGREERVELRAAIGFAARKYAWSLAAPLFPLVGVFLAGIPVALLGVLMRFDAGLLAVALLWPAALVCGLVIAVLLLGLVVGWPLMWPTICSEHHGDAFEAFSRTYSYVFQRPLQYLFYAAVAVALGIASWLLVSFASQAVILLASTAASWGAGTERMSVIAQGGLTGLGGLGSSLISASETFVRIIAVAFNFSFFFCVSTAIYLVLRRDVDRTDFDDVYVEDDQDQDSLPPLKPNADGVPGVAEDSKAAETQPRDAGQDAPSGDDAKS